MWIVFGTIKFFPIFNTFYLKNRFTLKVCFIKFARHFFREREAIIRKY